MGFWSEFTGKGAAGRANQAASTAATQVNQGYGAARTNLGSGYGQANTSLDRGRTSLTQGYGQSRTALTGGRNAAIGANGAALDAARGGTGAAVGTLQSATQDANSRLDPYASQGGRAFGMYGDALGANGREAQQQFVGNYAGDPFRDFNENRTTDAVMRRMNAAGLGNSGATHLAASRANLERGSQDYNQYLDRLDGMGRQGQQAAGQQGANAMSAAGQIAGYQDAGGRAVASIYGDRANIHSGYGQNMASLATGYGQNMAGQYGNQAAYDRGYGQELAGYDIDQAGTLASNEINRSNAVNQAKAAGLNNIMGLAGAIGGAAMGGFTPGMSGVSPFGNAMSFFGGGGLK